MEWIVIRPALHRTKGHDAGHPAGRLRHDQSHGIN
jgi:hypothetical protein